MQREKLALDASQRTKDEFGHLRVARTVISKAGVSPYFGREIPDYEKLGLDEDKIYHLFRDPIELERSADSFKGKQLLIKHIYVDSDDSKKDLTIGSIGSDIEFKDNKLFSDLSVWDNEAIELVESGKMQELSAGYSYDADMTKGTYEGVDYDGVMRNLSGNHVALVTRGRIGRDAIISDSLPIELEFNMKLKKGAKQRIAARLKALAKDEAGAEEIIREVAENIEHKPAFDKDALRELVGDDEKFEKIIELVGGVSEEADAEDEDKGKVAEPIREKLEEMDRDDRDAERDDIRERERGAEDEKAKTAMDADAIALSVQNRIEAKYQARDLVEPLVGRIALDGFATAKDVYAYALKHKGIACDGVNEAGLKQLVSMASSQSKQRVVAQDSDIAETSELTNRFKKG